jgi:hypothetical protein
LALDQDFFNNDILFYLAFKPRAPISDFIDRQPGDVHNSDLGIGFLHVRMKLFPLVGMHSPWAIRCVRTSLEILHTVSSLRVWSSEEKFVRRLVLMTPAELVAYLRAGAVGCRAIVSATSSEADARPTCSNRNAARTRGWKPWLAT